MTDEQARITEDLLKAWAQAGSFISPKDFTGTAQVTILDLPELMDTGFGRRLRLRIEANIDGKQRRRVLSCFESQAEAIHGVLKTWTPSEWIGKQFKLISDGRRFTFKAMNEETTVTT